ncbi:GCN5 family acetyltransferase [Mesorhizobium amorphae]
MPHEPAMQFRTASPADVALVRDVVRAAYSKWIPVIGREPSPMKADYDEALQKHQFTLLYLDTQIAGLIETVQENDHLWIENVCVLPAQQGKGLGKVLLHHAEEMARQAGHNETRLLTNAAFEANIALYERLGYVITEREPYMEGTTVYMRKRLALHL